MSAVYEKLPLPDKNASLDEILSNTPTHQGIQNMIINAEAREASAISTFCNKFGDEAKLLVLTAAHDHGVECGKWAVVVETVLRLRHLNFYKFFVRWNAMRQERSNTE